MQHIKWMNLLLKHCNETKFMGKLKLKSSGNNPISRKVLSGLRKTIYRKVIDISELKNAKIHAENLEKSVIKEKELSELVPK